jgi:hypothetical protein
LHVCKTGGRNSFVLLLYIDDILAFVDAEEAEKLRAHLVAKFGMVQFEIHGRLSYPGMEIGVTYERTLINMSFYVKQLLEDADENKSLTIYILPGMKETFAVE